MRNILIFLFFFISNYSYAQVYITATNGNGGPYTNLKSAFDVINAGMFTGNIQIFISGNTIETASAVLLGSGTGASNYTSILIIPSGGPRTISGFLASPLIDLNGADNVQIDGLNTGGDGLTIVNASTSSSDNVATIRFINDAVSNKVANCTIAGSNTGGNSGTILFSTGILSGNDNNSIINCRLEAGGSNLPIAALVCKGSTGLGQENSNISISNCNISDFFHTSSPSAAIKVIEGGNNINITNNRFYQSTARTYTAAVIHSIINISGGGSHVITNNTIGYSSEAGTGRYIVSSASGIGLMIIQLSVSNTTTTQVDGNTITAIEMTTSRGGSINTSGALCGINILQGNVDIGTTAPNIIGANSGYGAFTLLSTNSSFSTVVGIHSSSNGAINISNNVMGGFESYPISTGSTAMAGINVSGAASSLTIISNLIGNNTPENMSCGRFPTSGVQAFGIHVSAASTGSFISNNIIQHFKADGLSSSLLRGIYCQNLGSQSISVSDNTIKDMVTTPTFVNIGSNNMIAQGITVERGGQVIISGNDIYNLSLTQFITGPAETASIGGIGIFSGGTVTISSNRIHSIANSAPNGTSSFSLPTVSGIILHGSASPTGLFYVYNNMISLGSLQNTNTLFTGIWDQNHQSATGNTYSSKIFFNSVYITGTNASGDLPSSCYNRGNYNTGIKTHNVEIKNNIFINQRMGGSGKHYAISNNYGAAADASAGWQANASDHNALNASDPTAIGYWLGSWDISLWRLTSSGDQNSTSSHTINFIDFNSADLHLAGTSVGDQLLSGIPLSITNIDYDGQSRNIIKPYKGADEASIALPLRLLVFTVNRIQNANLLKWKVNCNIISSSSFIVEKSTDAISFEAIGNISSTAPDCKDYSFYDHNINAPIIYYRLKMGDQNSWQYSPVLQIRNGGKSFDAQLISKNEHSLSLNISSIVKTKFVINITDVNGKSIFRTNYSVGTGSQMVMVPLINLAKGVYYCSLLTSEGFKKTFPFIK